MLDSVRFTNFKSWPEAELEFGRITGLFGTNSSGKTSLIQFLLLLKQTKEATDRSTTLALNGPLVNLGVFEDMIQGHDSTKEIDWKLKFSVEKELALLDPSKKRTEAFERGQSVKVAGRAGAKDGVLRAEHLAYTLGSTTFALSSKSAGGSEFELSAQGSEFKFLRTQGRPWQLPGPVKSYAFPDQARTYFQNASLLSDLEAALERQFDSISYLGPLRDFPQRDYLWARSKPRDVGIRGNQAIDAILAATDANERRNKVKKGPLKPFQEMIALWLKELGLIHDFKVVEIAKGSNRWQAKVRVRQTGAEVLLTDVGFGISQVLPVITLLQYVPSGSTVILEQPEIHLHPLAQANLADAIINAALQRNIQVILESHSEHLLLRLQRRIAEEVIPNSDVKLYFCDVMQGKSKLKPLEIDLLGSISNWPEHFMGDAFGETYAAEVARLNRQRAAE